MIKKMCPVCDLPVSGANYCPRCKRIIKHPYIQNVDYYLNERHPDHESDCEFHNPYLEADHHEERQPQGQGQGRKVAPTHPAVGRPLPGGIKTPQGNRTEGAYRPPAPGGTGMPKMSRPAGKRNHSTRNLLITIGVMMFFTVLTGIGRSGYNYLRDKADNYTDSSDFDYDYTEFDDDEVAAAGKACEGYHHFPADGEAVGRVILDAVENSDYGYTVDSDSYYMDNYAFEGTTYFECWRSIYVTDAANAGYEETDENYFYQYIDLNYDSATGEFHEYTSNLHNEEASLALLEQFLNVVEEESGIAESELKAAEIMEEAREIVAQGQNNYIYKGIFAVEIYRVTDTLYINVTYNDPDEAVGVEL